MKRLLTLLSILSCLFVKAQITLTPYVTGLSVPVDIRNCGDSRLFVVEEVGRIRIIDSTGTLLSTPFMDISARVLYNGEQGLLGLAFAPDYATTGYFYVNYTSRPSGRTTISRFRVTAGDPNIADPNSEEILFTIYQPYSNHNGGSIAFSPIDGYLYIGTGDGGSQNDPGNRAQNPDSLLGKLLRIQVTSGVPGYTIPPGNPFAQQPSQGRGEVWGIGMRNPWRISFDRLTGDLWIGDVGQNTWEEVDMEPVGTTQGRNYGWRCYEGAHTFNTTGCAAASAFTPPVWEYQHLTGNCSVTGGYVYRGAQYANMYGKYFFTDYCVNQMRTLQRLNGSYAHTNLGTLANGSYVAFGEDKWGELYAADAVNGRIMRFRGTACQPVAAIQGGLSDTLFVCGSASLTLSTAKGNGFQYDWNVAGVPSLHDFDTLTVEPNGSPVQVIVTVTDTGGCTASDSVLVLPVALPVVSISGLDTLYCIDDAPIAVLPFPPGGTLSGTGISGISFDPVLAGEGTHVISYSYTDSYGCSADTSVTTRVDLCLTADQATTLARPALYPNPADGQLVLELPSRLEQEVEVRLMDITGKLVLNETYHLTPGRIHPTWQTSTWSSGTYVVQLKYGNGDSWMSRINIVHP